MLRTPEEGVYNYASNIGQAGENHRVRDLAQIAHQETAHDMPDETLRPITVARSLSTHAIH